MGRRKLWSEARRREILATHERSGLSLKAFADRRGLPYTTLVSWRKRAATAEPARLVPVEVAGAEVPAFEVRQAWRPSWRPSFATDATLKGEKRRSPLAFPL